MEWKVFKGDEFLEEANCQYDSIDKAYMFYGAKQVLVNYETKTAVIVE